MKKVIGTFLVLYTLLLTAACPVTPASLTKAKESSAKIAGYANVGVNLTRELYQANFLSLQQKDVVARKFVLLADAGIAFDLSVDALIRQYGNDSPPKSELERIVGVFDTQLVGAFLDILLELKVISSKDNYIGVLELIRTSVLVIAGVLGIHNRISHRLELAGG